MKKIVRLTESDLHNIVKESVKRVLQESSKEDLQNRLMMANDEIKKNGFRVSLKSIIDKYFPDFIPYNMEQRDYMCERMGLPDGYDVLGEIEYGSLIVNMKTKELSFSEISSYNI